MKRVVAIAVISFMAISLSACGTPPVADKLYTIECVEVAETKLRPFPNIKVKVNNGLLSLSTNSARAGALSEGQKVDIQYDRNFRITELDVSKKCRKEESE